MLRKLYEVRNRASDEKGFTLVELLVVILIIGILAAIAIPSFINQRSKANDASAKASAKTAQTAMETFATDNNGSYVGATTAGLQAIEATLNDSPAASLVVGGAQLAGSPTASTFAVGVTSVSSAGTQYVIERQASGRTIRYCDSPGQGGCRTGAVTGAPGTHSGAW